MHRLFVFLLLLWIVGSFFFWYVSLEKYDYTHHHLLKQFFEKVPIPTNHWKIVNTEPFNDQMTFLEVQLQDAQLFFTLEQYANREELRLVQIKNMTDQERKKK